MRKIFLSYSGILIGLRNGQIVMDDLEGGLFYFGCCKSAVTDDSDLPYPIHSFHSQEEREELMKLIPQVRQIVFAAESDGRADYRKPIAPNSWEELNALLVRNGFVAVDSRVGFVELDYSYPTACDLIKRSNPDLQPVTNTGY